MRTGQFYGGEYYDKYGQRSSDEALHPLWRDGAKLFEYVGMRFGSGSEIAGLGAGPNPPKLSEKRHPDRALEVIGGDVELVGEIPH